MSFAILRSYVQLSKLQESSNIDRDNQYLFLFEEPELYLHPIAQNILFDSLNQISNRHQVVVTTHSPFFFRPDHTDVFIKMQKRDCAPKPIARLIPIDTSSLSDRDLFQIISYENNNSAFFARKVLLVEGDSELIALPHIALSLSD